ncbi:MAG: HAD hydrolase-like protein [Elusimicrobia bacterium]|nr:HAD hydrolase-like protein [Elusimicrobiota bacterium]
MKNKHCLFLDFDGTLTDVKEKYYELYKTAKTNFGLNIFNKKIYWHYKTMGCPERNILLKNNQQAPAMDEYLSFRADHIEDRDYLALDRPIVKQDLLAKIGNHYDLYIVTMRHNSENLLWELTKMNICHYFKQIICRSNLTTRDIEIHDEIDQKTKLLKSCQPFQQKDILIGDTGLDYNVGQRLKLKTFLVYSGIRQKKVLLCGHIPGNILYKNINDILKKLCK